MPGAVLHVVLEAYVALRWVDFHPLIFGALFIAIVLPLPGGRVQAAARARRLGAHRAGVVSPIIGTRERRRQWVTPGLYAGS